MKFQKFHLSTVISFVFFIIFVVLLFSSALWFYNGSIKTIQSETNNYFNQNKKIVEIILDNHTNNLSDLTRQIANKYNFDESALNNNETQKYLEKMFDSNIDNKLDFMFLSFNNGEVIDVSLAIFDTKEIIKDLTNNKSEGTIFFRKMVLNEINIALLVSKQEVINSKSGRYIGDLYAGIILNDNFSIVDDIYNKLEVESLSIVLNNEIISSSTAYNNELHKQIQAFTHEIKTNELKVIDDLIVKRTSIALKGNDTSLETITIIKNDTFDKFYEDFVLKVLILSFLVLILFYISYKMIKKIIELPLNKLLNFASKSSKNQNVNKFEETRIEEFNNLGLKFERLILKIKRMNSKLEIKVSKRTSELEESNDELQFTIENLKNTQEKLIEAEKMASLGGLVAGVAHEINTPVGIGLTGITHFLHITEEINNLYNDDNLSQEELEEYLKTSAELARLINTNLDRTAHLIKSFKQVAVDQTSEEKRKFKLRHYIEEVLFSLNNVTKQTKLEIEVICEENIEINSYPGSISQILTNLIMNSIRHGFKSNEKGNINICVTQNNSEITFIYKDNGQGILSNNLDKIFDPFFTTNREKGGTGLGLNIIYNIITNSLGGSITCNSERGEGVEFVIIFKV